jgi:protein-disulfide isomerase/uncharacterized membrane protein
VLCAARHSWYSSPVSRPSPAAAPRVPPGARATGRGAFGWELITPLLCLAGLFLATFLTVMHFGLLSGDVSLGGVCGGEGDCNGVIFSRYGMLFGLPVSVWGMWYYIFAATLSSASLMLRREDRAPFVGATLWLTVVALAFDAWLAWAMAARVGLVCPLCVATYAINVAILLLTLRAARDLRGQPAGWRGLLPEFAGLDPAGPAYYREVLKLYLAILGAGVSVLVLALALVFAQTTLAAQKKQVAGLLEFMRSEPAREIPAGDLPARGPEQARLTIVVFSDFLCEQCKLASQYLDVVAAGHRDALRIVYASYPADQECNPQADKTLHPGACRLARAGECARREQKFWAFHDAVFHDAGPARVEKLAAYASRAGLDPAALEACASAPDSTSLATQVALARSLGVTATPTLFFNGRRVVGALKPWMLDAAVRTLLENERR